MRLIIILSVISIMVSCSEDDLLKASRKIQPPKSRSSKSINEIDESYNEAVNFVDWRIKYDYTDTEALKAAIDSGKSIFFPNGEYTINERISFSSMRSHYLGESESGVTIVYNISKDDDMWDNYLGVVTAHYVKFENITFSGNDLDVNVALFEIGSPDKTKTFETHYTQFKNCSIKNLKRTYSPEKDALSKSNDICGIRVWLTKARYFSFDNVKFDSISGYDEYVRNENGEVEGDRSTGLGFASGLLLFSNIPAEDIDLKSNGGIHGDILNCSFRRIYTENHGGNINYSDADGIRLYAPNSTSQNIDSTESFELNIINNVFEDVEKSAIKISAGRGIHIENTTVKSTGPNGITDMMTAIRIQPAIDVQVLNTIVEGDFKFIFNLIGQNITVDGLRKGSIDYQAISHFDGGSSIIQIQKDVGILNKNIRISNINDGYVRKVLKLRSDTNGQIDSDISLSKVNRDGNMTFYNNLGGGQGRIDIIQAENVTLDSVDIIDWTTGTRCLVIIDSKDITIDNSHFYAKSVGIETWFTIDPNVINSISFNNTIFKRANYPNSLYRFAYLKPLKVSDGSWGQIDKVKITNSSFYSHGFQTKDPEPLLIGANDVEIHNVQFYFMPSNEQKLPNAGVHINGAQNIAVSNVGLDSSPLYANGLGVYAILVNNSTDSDTNIDIDNVSSTNHGIWLKSSTNIQVNTNNISHGEISEDVFIN